MFGSVLNTILGAGIKLGANLINAWIEQRMVDRKLMAARDENILRLIADSQKETRSDPFVKTTRRILFLALTFTYCYLMLFYAMNPGITYEVVKPADASGGILSWFFGETKWVTFELTGGLLLASFVDLMFMVIGFYAIPSSKRQ
jgi:hypothetical protein